MRNELFRLLADIRPTDDQARKQAKMRWNSVAKPIGSLGILEEDIIKIAGIRGDFRNICVDRSALAVMCADHGVVKEGVTQTGQEVTRIVAENFTRKMSSVTIMCQVTGTDVFPVDMGMLGDTPMEGSLAPFTLLNRKTAFGSQNIVRQAAMSEEQCVHALLAGIRLVGELKELGYSIIATGEMGIGNTTPSSAMASVLMNCEPKEVTGRGAGLSDSGLLKKREAVEAAVRRFYHTYPELSGKNWKEEDAEAAMTLLRELGGFDIAGMTGCFLGAAIHRVPVLIDGMISSVSALLACSMNRFVREFILASHVSAEPAGQRIMDAIGLHAPLHCGMHLGEGSGAVAFLPLLKMGAEVYEKMGTFKDISVDQYVDYEAEGETGTCVP